MGWLLNVFSVLASCGSICTCLSLAPTLYGIHKARATGHTPISPLVSMLVNSHLWMMYGYLDGNYFPLFATFIFGTTVSSMYVAVFYRYTHERAFVTKLVGGAAVVLFVCSLYAVLGGLGYTNQSRDGVIKTMGYIGVVAACLMYTSPFEKIAQVFKYRCGVFIPIHMVVVGAVNSAVWVVYSLLEGDWFVFGPNVFTLVMGLVQIAVYLAFNPNSHPLPLDFELDEGARAQKKTQAAGTTTTDAAPTYLPLQSPITVAHNERSNAV